MDTFDFILEDESKPLDGEYIPPNYTGPNLATISKLTKKKFGQAIFNVLERLGGEDWLYVQALADPKNFMELLKKMVPAQTVGDDLTGLVVKLIDRYACGSSTPQGNASIAISGSRTLPPPTAVEDDGHGQPIETATGGNPDVDIEIKDTYAVDNDTP
jgi:hypothetical protein